MWMHVICVLSVNLALSAAQFRPVWTIWSPWSHCSATCGRGVQSRARFCLPSGSGCRGLDYETRSCLLIECPSNGVCIQRSACTRRNGDCLMDIPWQRDCKVGAFVLGLCEPPNQCRCCIAWRDICRPNPCQNGGTCLMPTRPVDGTEYQGYSCRCRSGFSGDNCEIVTPHVGCLLRPACSRRRGECKVDVPGQRDCRVGAFILDLCEPPNQCRCCVAWQDICRPNPCQNRGQCVMPTRPVDGTEYQGYSCRCRSGFSGDNCEITTSPSRCVQRSKCRQKNGECKVDVRGQRDCTVGAFVLGLCEPPDECLCCIAWGDLCTPNPCLQDGECSPGPRGRDGEVAGYTCQCKPGLFGDNCELGELIDLLKMLEEFIKWLRKILEKVKDGSCDPDKPGTPQDPDPTNPGDPENPDKPNDPANPVDPTKPVDPANPVDPTKPVDPANPVDPEDPGDPDQPEDKDCPCSMVEDEIKRRSIGKEPAKFTIVFDKDCITSQCLPDNASCGNPKVKKCITAGHKCTGTADNKEKDWWKMAAQKYPAVYSFTDCRGRNCRPNVALLVPKCVCK